MSVPPSPPETWARAKRAQTDAHALPQIRWCHSIDHLRAAVAAEADHDEPRQKRIATINQRIQQLKRVQA